MVDADRLRPVCSTFQPDGEVSEVVLQRLAVVPPRQTIHTRRGVPVRLAISTHRMWPSASPYSVGTPEKIAFAAEYPARTYPCQRFATVLADSHA